MDVSAARAWLGDGFVCWTGTGQEPGGTIAQAPPSPRARGADGHYHPRIWACPECGDGEYHASFQAVDQDGIQELNRLLAQQAEQAWSRYCAKGWARHMAIQGLVQSIGPRLGRHALLRPVLFTARTYILCWLLPIRNVTAPWSTAAKAPVRVIVSAVLLLTV